MPRGLGIAFIFTFGIVVSYEVLHGYEISSFSIKYK